MKTAPGVVTEVIKSKMPGVNLKPVSWMLLTVKIIPCYR